MVFDPKSRTLIWTANSRSRLDLLNYKTDGKNFYSVSPTSVELMSTAIMLSIKLQDDQGLILLCTSMKLLSTGNIPSKPRLRQVLLDPSLLRWDSFVSTSRSTLQVEEYVSRWKVYAAFSVQTKLCWPITHPRSRLKKKSYAICYRYMREGCARMEAIAAYMKSFDDIADLLPKHRPDFQGRHYLLDHSWGCGLPLREQGEPHRFLFGLLDFWFDYVEYSQVTGTTETLVDCRETTTILILLLWMRRGPQQFLFYLRERVSVWGELTQCNLLWHSSRVTPAWGECFDTVWDGQTSIQPATPTSVGATALDSSPTIIT